MKCKLFIKIDCYLLPQLIIYKKYVESNYNSLKVFSVLFLFCFCGVFFWRGGGENLLHSSITT